MISAANSLLVIFLFQLFYFSVEGEVCYKKLYHKKLGEDQLCRLPLANKHNELSKMKNAMKCCKRGAAGYYSQLAPIGRHSRKFICLSCEDLLDERQINKAPSNWSESTDWSNCTCGDMPKNRTRICSNSTCVEDRVETESCLSAGCADVEWSSWSSFTDCSATCGTGVQIRTRICESLSCPGNSTETEEIECSAPKCPVDGGWSDWKVSGLCSTTCGRGKRALIRKCNKPKPRYGGMICNGTDIKYKNCSVKTKCPIHGEWSFWTRWGACSLEDGITCGQGIQNRTRTCDAPRPKHGGDNCTGANMEEKACFYKSCDDESMEGSGLNMT